MLSYNVVFVSFFFYLKQKTAYEILRSDWSSDVCSSDLLVEHDRAPRHVLERADVPHGGPEGRDQHIAVGDLTGDVGRADPAGAVVDHHPQVRDEPRGLRRPVAHDGRWCDHESGA